MFVFILIILIAELIIAISLINCIVKFNSKICILNEDIRLFRPILSDGFKKMRSSIEILQNSIGKILIAVNKKKRQFTTKLVLTAFMYASLVLFKRKYKNAALIFQALVIVKDYIDKLEL